MDPRQVPGGDPRRSAGGPPPAGGYGQPPRQPDPRQPPDPRYADPRQSAPRHQDPRPGDPRQQPPRQPDPRVQPDRTQVDPRSQADPRTQPDPRSQPDPRGRPEPRRADPWEEPRRHRSDDADQDEPRESRSGSHSRRRAEPDRGRSASEPEQARPVRKPRSRHSATVSVLGMTVASLVGVVLLAVQANGQSPQSVTAAQNGKPAASVTATALPSGAPSQSAAANPLALPANSGSGKRIVYSLSGQRVWLVTSDGSTVQRTFQIVPGTVPAPSGTYHVSGRDSGETGSDGTSVQYVVFFDNPATVNSSTSFAFDAEADVTGLPAPPKGHTGAVRTTQADAVAIWYFAPIGTTVVVV